MIWRIQLHVKGKDKLLTFEQYKLKRDALDRVAFLVKELEGKTIIFSNLVVMTDAIEHFSVYEFTASSKVAERLVINEQTIRRTD